MKYKKALLTVGAIGVLGTAGSFGTFAAFTDELPTENATYTAGTVDVQGTFQLPANIASIGTAEPASAGQVTITNNGTEPVQVWMDQDGPIGTITDLAGPAGGFSSNLLAENISMSSTLTVDGGTPYNLDQDTRLWKVFRRGLSPLPNSTLTAPLALAPTKSAVLDYTVKLRERNEGVGDTSALDNAMQGLSLASSLKVKAIENINDATNDLGNPTLPIPFDNGL